MNEGHRTHDRQLAPSGAEQSDRSPMTMVGGDLLLLSHGYLGHLVERPALRGRQGRTLAEQVSRPARARLVRFPQERAGRPRRSGVRLASLDGCSGTKPSVLRTCEKPVLPTQRDHRRADAGDRESSRQRPSRASTRGRCAAALSDAGGSMPRRRSRPTRSGQSFRRSLFDYPFRHACAGPRRL